MVELRQIEHDILAIGKVDGEELELLRRWVYAGGKVDRQTADHLVELHKRVQHRTPAFESSLARELAGFFGDVFTAEGFTSRLSTPVVRLPGKAIEKGTEWHREMVQTMFQRLRGTVAQEGDRQLKMAGLSLSEISRP